MKFRCSSIYGSKFTELYPWCKWLLLKLRTHDRILYKMIHYIGYLMDRHFAAQKGALPEKHKFLSGLFTLQFNRQQNPVTVILFLQG